MVDFLVCNACLLPGHSVDERGSIVCSNMESEGFARGHLYVQVTVVADAEIDDGVGRIAGRLERNVHIAALIGGVFGKCRTFVCKGIT